MSRSAVTRLRRGLIPSTAHRGSSRKFAMVDTCIDREGGVITFALRDAETGRRLTLSFAHTTADSIGVALQGVARADDAEPSLTQGFRLDWDVSEG